MSARGSLTVPARLEEISHLIDRAIEACRLAGGDEDACYDVRLAVEEVLTNVVRHGYRGTPGEMGIEWQAQPGEVRLAIEDRAPVFRPDEAPEPDLEADIMDRPVGGLGWFLVKKVMDEVGHECREGGGNRVTLRKRVGPAVEPADERS